LSILQASGQVEAMDAVTSSTGSCFVCLEGLNPAAYNQASLGNINRTQVSICHARPYMLGELGISTLSGYLPVGNTGLGGSFTAAGIPGFSHHSLWFGCGTRISPKITGGVGIHLWNHGIEGHPFFHTGAGCALGIVMQASERLSLGFHVRDPVSWSDLIPAAHFRMMEISAGFSWKILNTAFFYSELHLAADESVQWRNGISLRTGKSLVFMLGFRSAPFTLTTGLSLEYRNWTLSISMTCCFDTGATPISSLSYGW
jgi:hypothetical protein